jgi:hypothetical protein
MFAFFEQNQFKKNVYIVGENHLADYKYKVIAQSKTTVTTHKLILAIEGIYPEANDHDIHQTNEGIYNVSNNLINFYRKLVRSFVSLREFEATGDKRHLKDMATCLIRLMATILYTPYHQDKLNEPIASYLFSVMQEYEKSNTHHEAFEFLYSEVKFFVNNVNDALDLQKNYYDTEKIARFKNENIMTEYVKYSKTITYKSFIFELIEGIGIIIKRQWPNYSSHLAFSKEMYDLLLKDPFSLQAASAISRYASDLGGISQTDNIAKIILATDDTDMLIIVGDEHVPQIETYLKKHLLPNTKFYYYRYPFCPDLNHHGIKEHVCDPFLFCTVI